MISRRPDIEPTIFAASAWLPVASNWRVSNQLTCFCRLIRKSPLGEGKGGGSFIRASR